MSLQLIIIIIIIIKKKTIITNCESEGDFKANQLIDLKYIFHPPACQAEALPPELCLIRTITYR
jgi:hypothetical protein